jgi:cell division protein FtsB
MSARPITLTLLLLVALVQASLWFGKGSVPHVAGLQTQLTAQLATNSSARARNARMNAEVSDLKEGLEMVEETARRELGLVKADELLVQYGAKR